MAKKGKKSKMVHISKLHKNHPYVKAIQTRTTVGYIVLAIILLAIIGVMIWGFVTNWGQAKNEKYCGSCTKYQVSEPSDEEFTANHCGKYGVGSCHGMQMAGMSSEEFTANHCGKYGVGSCHGMQMAAARSRIKETFCPGGCGADYFRRYPRNQEDDEIDSGIF